MGWQDQYFERGYLNRWTLPPPDAARERTVAGWLSLSGVSPTARILDVGSGHGAHSLALAKTGGAVVALDASAALLARAQAHSALQPASVLWVRGSMRALPFRRHFDLALLISAFGYFDTEAQGVDVLREIARVLQPTGRLLLRNPNAISIRRVNPKAS
jgi:sarcosine/dimethylglycine N-methyltransferase